MRRRKSPAALTFTFLLGLMIGHCPAVFAAPADSSSDGLWNDQTQPGSSFPAASQGGAPLCTVDTFKQSTLIQSGAWPGLGPFKGDGTQFTDATQNRVTLQVDRDKITSLELSVADKPKQLTKMQIAADFLLESVGATPARISDFNTQLTKSKSDLTSSSIKNPLSLAAGRYLVYIYPESAHKDLVNFVIRVNSKEMPPEPVPIATTASPLPTASTAPSTSTSTVSTPPASTSTPTRVATVPAVTATPDASDEPPLASASAPPTAKPPEKVADRAPTIFMSNTTADTTKVAVTTPSDAQKPFASGSAGPDLKSEFQDLINDWQQVKRLAVKDRDASALTKVLGGKALARQTDAIKWLQEHHKHYDLAARNISVDGYTETTKGQKYAVFAQMTEMSKYIDDATNEVMKDTTSTYKVNYTIEKLDGHWAITDSATITPNSQSASKPPSNASR